MPIAFLNEDEKYLLSGKPTASATSETFRFGLDNSDLACRMRMSRIRSSGVPPYIIFSFLDNVERDMFMALANESTPKSGSDRFASITDTPLLKRLCPVLQIQEAVLEPEPLGNCAFSSFPTIRSTCVRFYGFVFSDYTLQERILPMPQPGHI